MSDSLQRNKMEKAREKRKQITSRKILMFLPLSCLSALHDSFSRAKLEAEEGADDINTCSRNSHNKEILSTNTRGGRQQAGERSLNTNHCGVLAAGRRQGEAHRGDEVKGILSLRQILQWWGEGKTLKSFAALFNTRLTLSLEIKRSVGNEGTGAVKH